MFKWINSKIGMKLLIMFSIVLILSMVSIIYIATQMVAEFGEFSASANEANIRSTANAFLSRIAHEQAMRYENTFNKFAATSSVIAKQAAFFLENMALYGKTPFKPNEKLVIYPHNGIFSNDRSESAMALYWGSDTMSSGISKQINTLSHLDPLLETIKKENSESVACYAVAESGIARYYPNVHGVEKLPPTTKFDIRNANWYVIARPENNPQRKTVWSNIYLDSVGHGLMTTASTPVYSKGGQFLGATGVDITLDKIVNDILGYIPSCHRMENLFSFLVDNQGRLIAFPPEYLGMFEIKIDRNKLADATVILKQSLLDSSNAEVRKIGQSVIEKNHQVSSFKLKGRPYFISFHFMPSTGWRLGVVVPESVILDSIRETRNTLDLTVKKMTRTFTLTTVFFLIVSIAAIAVFSIKNFIRPLSKISKGALRVKEGDLTTYINIHTKDEIGSLARLFNNMVDTLREAKEREYKYTQTLEQKVKDRTKEISIRNEDLKKIRERLELAMDAGEHGFWDWDLDTDDIYFSSRYFNMLGYESGELPMNLKTWVKLMHPDDRKTVVPKVENYVENAEPYEVEFRLKTKSGGWKWISGRGKSYEKDVNGVPHRAVGIHVDITDRKQAEVALRESEDQLQQAQKMEAIGTLAGGIAHDFNNILFPMFGYLEMMLQDVPEDNPLYYHLVEVFNGAKRARDLVRQILTFGRQSDHKLKPLKVQSVIKEALKLIKSSLPSTIKITQNIQNDCGLVLADPIQIHQIVMNLCTNAFHAMEEKGGKLTITLKEVEIAAEDIKDWVITSGTYVCLTVADNGIGMAQSVMDRMFDPYFTTKEKDKGTGLGLAVIHGIVKSYRGHIAVDSEFGKGAEFRIYLPMIEKQSETMKIDTDSPIQKGTERILLVDDQDIIVQMEKQMLERLGYHVTARTSSMDSLEAFKAQPDKFDLVITDMTMPNMTGDKLASALIKIRPDIPIILCTGFSETMSKEKAKSLGIKGFLMKPIVLTDLSNIIRNVLNS